MTTIDWTNLPRSHAIDREPGEFWLDQTGDRVKKAADSNKAATVTTVRSAVEKTKIKIDSAY